MGLEDFEPCTAMASDASVKAAGLHLASLRRRRRSQAAAGLRAHLQLPAAPNELAEEVPRPGTPRKKSEKGQPGTPRKKKTEKGQPPDTRKPLNPSAPSLRGMTAKHPELLEAWPIGSVAAGMKFSSAALRVVPSLFF